jgi:hypothetical protein
MQSFLGALDDKDLSVANKEVQDLVQIACFTPEEKKVFLSLIKKELSSQGLTLDSLS